MQHGVFLNHRSVVGLDSRGHITGGRFGGVLLGRRARFRLGVTSTFVSSVGELHRSQGYQEVLFAGDFRNHVVADDILKVFIPQRVSNPMFIDHIR